MSDNVKYYPLTHPQLGIWYTEKMYPGTSIGIVAATLKIKEKVDVALLEKAINLLIKNHDSYRLRFKEIDGEPVQYFVEYSFRKIDYYDFSKESLENLYKWDNEQTQEGFEIIDSDLFYFAIVKVSEYEYGIFTKLHHLITDGWSMVKAGNLVLGYYLKLLNNVYDNIECCSYKDRIENELSYIRSERFNKDKAFWQDQMHNLNEITSLKTTVFSNELKAKRKTFVLPTKLSTKIRQHCKDYSTSIFSLFLAAFSIYINRTSSKNDIIIGIPVLNRSNINEKSTLGMFVSMIPIRIRVDDYSDFRSFCDVLNTQWYSSLKHQRYPYEQIIKDVRENKRYFDKLHDIALSYQNAKFEKGTNMISQEGRWHFNGYQRESLYIHINDREDDGNIILDFDYNCKLFKTKEVEFIYDHLIRLLWHALDNPIRKISCIEIISEREKHKLIYDFNNTKVLGPNCKTIHEMLGLQVKKTPNDIAIVFKGNSITYKELNQETNKLAWFLRDCGVKQESIIGILMKRSIDLLIAIIAVLKAGGMYLPIDPEYPSNRIEYMLNDSNTMILITDGSYKCNEKVKHIINIQTFFKKDFDAKSNNDLVNINRSNDAAYLLYTSGSTGNPKGVVIEHSSVVNFINGMIDYINFTNKTIISLTTCCFDIFVLESLLPLTQGAKVVLADEHEQKLPEMIKKALKEYKVNILQITPTRLKILLDCIAASEFFESLTDVIVGGEPFSEGITDKVRKISNADIYNVYGPTETTVWSTVKKLDNSNIINIGKPIRNTQIYILDKHLNLVPIGIPGTLYIGGKCLSRGYYNNKTLTKEKFIDNPYVKGEIVYNTGDIARWYPQGEIQFIGRSDNQIKINGYRVELGEIELKLKRCRDVKDAAVSIRRNKTGNIYLCAYIVTNKYINESEIRRFLLTELPYYMIPTCFVYLNELPATPNGKLDRAALPEPGEENNIEYESSRNQTDRLLVDIWSTIFERDNIGINDNFFNLEGDSLKIIQLQSLLIKYNIFINTQDVYENQTVKELSDMITYKYKCNNVSAKNVVNIKEIGILDDCEINTNQEVKNILLTGTTGFLGIHLLDKLLKSTECTIFCMIRKGSHTDIEQRIKSLFKHYLLDCHSDEIGKRIVLLDGDITKERFGITDILYEELSVKIDSVINCAAIVKHYGFYDEFYNTNVAGTNNIIKFCMKGNSCLHQISTTSISGNHLCNRQELFSFSENDFYVGQSFENNVYTRSKFEAEQLIYENVRNGLKAAVYRVGILTGRYIDGVFQPNISDNSFYSKIKSFIELGCIPEEVKNQTIEFTSVDLASDAIVRLLFVNINKCRIYHIFNHNKLSADNTVQILNSFGYRVLFAKDILGKAINQEAFYGLVNDITENGLNLSSDITIESKKTIGILSKLGFSWPLLSKEYIRKLLLYMEQVEFLGKGYMNGQTENLD